MVERTYTWRILVVAVALGTSVAGCDADAVRPGAAEGGAPLALSAEPGSQDRDVVVAPAPDVLGDAADVTPPNRALIFLAAFEKEPRDPAFADCAEARLRADFEAYAASHPDFEADMVAECRTAHCRVDLQTDGRSFAFRELFPWPCLAGGLGRVDSFGAIPDPGPGDGPVSVLKFSCDCGDLCYDVPLATPADACAANP